MSARKWLEVRNLVAKNEGDPVEFLIYEQIGKSWWDGSGTSAKEFAEAFNQVPAGRKISLRINSPGGAIADGLAIFNTVAKRKQDVTAFIDGYALSAASFLMLAAGKVVAPANAIVMIHKPQGMVDGDADAMRQMASILDTHQESIASIYANKTGKAMDDINASLNAETWFTGTEAKDYGLVDEVTEDIKIENSFDLSQFRNLPESLRPAQTRISNLPTKANNDSALSGAVPVDGAAGKQGDNNKGDQTMPDNTPAPAATNPPAATPAPAPVAPAAATNRLSPEDIQAIVTALRPEPTAPAPASPVAGRVQIVSEGLNDLLKTKGNTRNQFEFLKNHWSELVGKYPMVRNANTDSASGALTTAILSTGTMTTLQNRLAPLDAFARNFAQGRIGRNVIQVPHVTAGGTAQSNPTDFQDTTNFVSTVINVAVTPAHLVAGAHITNAELQNGWQIGWFAEVKAAELADKIQSVVNAIITTGNFTATPLVSTAAAFGSTELKSLWGTIKKASVKNIILDGEYFAQFLPDSMEDYNPLASRSYPGWDGFYLNTYWTGATTNTVGFACNPQAIGVGAGLPVEAPNMSGADNLTENVITLENGMQISNFMWFDAATRNIWWTIECMFGAAKGDGSAGVLIKSA